MAAVELKNPHPGDILRHEFLAEYGLSQNRLAQLIGVPPNRIHAIVNGTRAVTADTDLRLCRLFRLTEGYFLRLQNAYDTLEAKRRLKATLSRIKPWPAVVRDAAD
jgi:addiction module HigA family antidote